MIKLNIYMTKIQLVLLSNVTVGLYFYNEAKD